MRFCIVLLAIVAAAAAVPYVPKLHAADQQILQKQQDIIGLLEQITDVIPNEKIRSLGQNFDIQANINLFTKPALVQYYVGEWKAGHLQPKGTVFTPLISRLHKEVTLLIDILIGAPDYQTFLATAAWARIHINEGQVLKAICAAVLQRPDLEGIVLPPIYEVLPHYYFDTRIIQQVQNIKTKSIHGVEGVQNVVIPINYTVTLPEGEEQLSYWTQDIGLALYYSYIDLVSTILPRQVGVQGGQTGQGTQGGLSQSGHGQGSIWCYLHQQLLARYNLERLGNGLGPIPDVHLEHVNVPLNPHLRTIDGVEFQGRPIDVHLTHGEHKKLVHVVQTLENRLREAIDMGLAVTPQGVFLSLYQPQGLDILGHLIQGSGKSVNPRYYGSLQLVARKLLGNVPEINSIWDYSPAVLDLGDIAVRDPVFYSLFKRILHLVLDYQESLPAYQANDVVVPGVKIEKVDVSQLVTYFSDYYVNLDSASVDPARLGSGHTTQGQVHVKGLLQRLDHKPYEYQITVQSEKIIPGAVVRVFLGPKFGHDGRPISISEHREEFVELDQFVHDLQQGQSIIVRHSSQSPIQSFDAPGVDEIKQHIDNAVRSQNPFYVTEPEQIYGFPARLALPKGTQQGLPLQWLVVISTPTLTQVPHGPVLPSYIQSYQEPRYGVVTSEDYPQQGQVPVVDGVQELLEVVPHYEDVELEKIHGINKIPVSDLYVSPLTNDGLPNHVSSFLALHQSQNPVLGQQVQGHGQHRVHGQQHHYGQDQLLHQSVVGGGQHVPVGQVVEGGYVGGRGIVGSGGVLGGGVVGGGLVSGVSSSGIQGGPWTLGQKIHGSGHWGGIHQGVQGVVGQNVHPAQQQFYQVQPISHIIGGAISLDGRPLGYPLNRPLSLSALYVPNIHITDVIVYHEENINISY